jgi:two-component system cell cycle sensor histidine kinase/response regulator CckA
MAYRLHDEAETLLVVDDDELIRKLEVRILRQLGHKVLEAEGPVEAMRLAAATPTIHLLLTDFSMPQANGLELARRFRAVHPKTPVLIVSGSLQAIDGGAGHLDGVAMLAKPFTPEDLAHTVRALLSDATNHHAVASPYLKSL